MGLVTLNLSMVLMMMEGVVRKKRRMKSATFSITQRSHQLHPRNDKFSLKETEGEIMISRIVN